LAATRWAAQIGDRVTAADELFEWAVALIADELIKRHMTLQIEEFLV
jgi:hypothetical protein